MEDEDELEGKEEDEQEGGKAGGHDAASDSDDSLADFSSPPKLPLGSQGEGSQGERREEGDRSPKRLLEEEGQSPLYSPPAKVQSAVYKPN